jgi:hypothetical protein
VVNASDHALFTASMPRAASRTRVLRCTRHLDFTGPLTARSSHSDAARDLRRATGRTLCDLRQERVASLRGVRRPSILRANSGVPLARITHHLARALCDTAGCAILNPAGPCEAAMSRSTRSRGEINDQGSR